MAAERAIVVGGSLPLGAVPPADTGNMAFGASGEVVVGVVAVGGSTLLQGPGAEEYIQVEFDFVEVVVVVGKAAAGDMGFALVEVRSS